MCPAPAVQERILPEEPIPENPYEEPLTEQTIEQLKDMIARMQNKRGRPTQKLKDLKEKLKTLEEEERPSKRTKNR
jgi:uncharacterized coiled-coil protein SlyX